MPRKKKTAKKTASAKPAVKYRIGRAEKARTKSDIFNTIADNADLSRKQVAQVFDVMSGIMAKDLKKTGPQIFTVPGLMKVTVKRKPATKSRKGINPFTGEETIFKAKPARNVIKVRALKALKDMV